MFGVILRLMTIGLYQTKSQSISAKRQDKSMSGKIQPTIMYKSVDGSAHLTEAEALSRNRLTALNRVYNTWVNSRGHHTSVVEFIQANWQELFNIMESED